MHSTIIVNSLYQLFYLLLSLNMLVEDFNLKENLSLIMCMMMIHLIFSVNGYVLEWFVPGGERNESLSSQCFVNDCFNAKQATSEKKEEYWAQNMVFKAVICMFNFSEQDLLNFVYVMMALSYMQDIQKECMNDDSGEII